MKHFILFYFLFFYSLVKCQSAPKFDHFNFENLTLTTQSFLEFSYGLTTLKYNPYFKPTVAKSNLTEIKYGMRITKPAGNYNIMEFEDDYFFSSYISSTIPKNNSEIDFNLWRFGLGLRKGYGYIFSNNIAIFPYYQMGLVWSRGEFSEPQIMSFTGNTSYFQKFDKELKFGTINNSGLNIKLTRFLTFGSSFETSVIFPRYLAAKQFGSFFIELLSQTGIDYLTKGVIIKTAPNITPAVYFLLKNGLSYLFYNFKKEKMNWPFDTTAPLTLETFKFNIAITF